MEELMYPSHWHHTVLIVDGALMSIVFAVNDMRDNSNFQLTFRGEGGDWTQSPLSNYDHNSYLNQIYIYIYIYIYVCIYIYIYKLFI